MYDVALRIANNLHFDMFWILQIFFQINFIAAESFHGFGFSAVVRVFQFGIIADHTHTTAAATVDSFNHDWVAMFFNKGFYFVKAVNSTVAARNHRNAS